MSNILKGTSARLLKGKATLVRSAEISKILPITLKWITLDYWDIKLTQSEGLT